MAVQTHLKATSLALVVASGLATASGVRADDGDRPHQVGTLTLIGPTARTLTFDSRTKEGARVAALNIVLQSKAARGTLDVRLVPASPHPLGATTVHINAHVPKLAGTRRPVLYVQRPAMLKIRSGRRAIVGLRLAVGRTGRPAATAGTLLIGLRGQPRVAPLTIAVSAQGPQATFAPSPAKLKVTQQAGPFSGENDGDGLSQSVLVKGPGAAAWVDPSHRAQVRSTLRSDPNSSVLVVLSLPDRLKRDGLASARLDVSKIDGPGKYTGQQVLDPSSPKPATLPVEVTVRHGLFWPLLLVSVGAIIGGLGVAMQDRRRRRNIVRIGLKRAVEGYAAQDRADRREEEPLSDDMYRPDALGHGIRFPGRRACKQRSDDWGRVANLYCDARRAKDEAELDVLADEAEEVVAAFERWHALRRGVRALRIALRRANPGPRSTALAETTNLAASVAVEPDAETAAKLVDRFERQRRVLAAYGALQHLYGELDAASRGRLARYAPETVYTGATSEPERTPADTYTLLLKLAAAQDVVLHPDRPVEREEDLELADLDMSRLAGGAAFALAPGSPVIDAFVPSWLRRGRTGSDSRSAAAIERGVKRWDLSLFLVTAIATLLAYTLPVWTDTWGSFADYATAFAAGLLGQVVVGGAALSWTLFPSLRSYRLAGAKPKEPPAATADGGVNPA
jgi:hypothetical protein